MLVKKNKKAVNEFIKIQNKRLLDRIQREFLQIISNVSKEGMEKE